MQIADAPFSKVTTTTLRKILKDPAFQGWKVKVVKDEPFLINFELFMATQGENNPLLDQSQTAYYNESGTVILMWTGYSYSPVVTLLSWTAALDYQSK